MRDFIYHTYNETGITSHSLENRDLCVDIIYKSVQTDPNLDEMYNDFSLEIMGSSANSLCDDTSDLDLILIFPHLIEGNPVDILRSLLPGFYWIALN